MIISSELESKIDELSFLLRKSRDDENPRVRFQFEKIEEKEVEQTQNEKIVKFLKTKQKKIFNFEYI